MKSQARAVGGHSTTALQLITAHSLVKELYSPSMVHGPMVTLIWAIAFTTTPLKYSIGTTVAPAPSDSNRIV